MALRDRASPRGRHEKCPGSRLHSLHEFAGRLFVRPSQQLPASENCDTGKSPREWMAAFIAGCHSGRRAMNRSAPRPLEQSWSPRTELEGFTRFPGDHALWRHVPVGFRHSLSRLLPIRLRGGNSCHSFSNPRVPISAHFRMAKYSNPPTLKRSFVQERAYCQQGELIGWREPRSTSLLALIHFPQKLSRT